MPGLNGFEVCKRVRKQYEGAILILTTSDEHEISGLEMGADDFLTKPISPQRLRARIAALLRRANNITYRSVTPSTVPLVLGDYKIFVGSRSVKINGKELLLSTPEFDLLVLLAQHHGEIVSRELIFKELKGITYDGTNRSIDILVSYLRAKLCKPSIIRTIRGKGYLLSVE